MTDLINRVEQSYGAKHHEVRQFFRGLIEDGVLKLYSLQASEAPRNGSRGAPASKRALKGKKLPTAHGPKIQTGLMPVRHLDEYAPSFFVQRLSGRELYRVTLGWEIERSEVSGDQEPVSTAGHAPGIRHYCILERLGQPLNLGAFKRDSSGVYAPTPDADVEARLTSSRIENPNGTSPRDRYKKSLVIESRGERSGPLEESDQLFSSLYIFLRENSRDSDKDI